MIDHQDTPLGEHFAAYLTHLEAEGTSPDHRGNVNRCLRRIAAECRLSKLADLTRDAFERWLVAKAKEGMGARTRNLYRASAVAFCNWCVETQRLRVNPLAPVKKADEEADSRRKRRALTENELVRLLEVVRRRPLVDAMTIRRGKRRGEAVARLQEQTRRALEALGWERALMYKTLVLTGLRKGELASLTIGQLDLDADPPFLVLNPADEKNREGSTIPLRADLAADLREWLAEKATALQEAARGTPAVGSRPTGKTRQDRFWMLSGTILSASDCRTRVAGQYAALHRVSGLGAHSGSGPETCRHSEAG
jgi:integrase